MNLNLNSASWRFRKENQTELYLKVQSLPRSKHPTSQRYKETENGVRRDEVHGITKTLFALKLLYFHFYTRKCNFIYAHHGSIVFDVKVFMKLADFKSIIFKFLMSNFTQTGQWIWKVEIRK
jgi:hypothetical protein